jgi:hypothetical protein
MSRALAFESLAVGSFAAILIAVLALPVLRAPTERIFGMEIVGRHYDPFMVMEDLSQPLRIGRVYSQPVTDLPGAMLARLMGPVAGYNALVLLTFPLSAMSAYLLARHLAISRAASMIAALAFAFSPFHLSQAAYHPHIAQTHWIPLYLLALWNCLDRGTRAAMGYLAAATIAVTMSNFYGGLIAAVVTPFAIGAHWFGRQAKGTRPVRGLAITCGVLAIVAAAEVTYVRITAPALFDDAAAFSYPPQDLIKYGARWWSYLMPPVEHPWLGNIARRTWDAAGVRDGLLEQQLSLGFGIITLALIGISSSFRREGARDSIGVAALVIVGAVAWVVSLAPERTGDGFTIRPSTWLYGVLPMFRSYGRFGVVVQLMTVLVAGVGIDRLRRAGTPVARVVCVTLLLLCCAEYAVRPSAMSRDVLPTSAHRWVMRQPGARRVLDCTPLSLEAASITWLTNGRITLLGTGIDDCAEPRLADTLAARRYTHMIVRQAPAAQSSFEGLSLAVGLDDAQVFSVTTTVPPIFTAGMQGFHRREGDADWTWRWMIGGDGAWTIVNTGFTPVVATLDVELSAFHIERQLEVQLDGRLIGQFAIERPRRRYFVGPLTVAPGDHQLSFHVVEPATVAGPVIGNGDPRPLAVAVGAWRWRAEVEEQP